MPYQAKSVAAGGANASAFGPTAASTLYIPCFFAYGFFVNGKDMTWHTLPRQGTRLAFHSASPFTSSRTSLKHFTI